MKSIKYVALAACFFSMHAFADDQADRQTLFKFATENSPTCQGLPIDVPKNIVYKDGNALAEPGLQAIVSEDVDMQNRLQNCLAEVSNVLQSFQENLSPTLSDKLKKATLNFLTSVSVLSSTNKNPKILTPTATIGIRG